MATRERTTTPAASQWLAWIGIVLLCLVGGRGLVVCDGPHCDSRIEFAHSSPDCRTVHDHGTVADHCCSEPAEPDSDDSDSPRAGHACGHGCSDTALQLQTGPLPQRVLLPANVDTAFTAIAWLPPRLAFADNDCRQLPPPTGPPRLDRRAQLRATTVLRS